MFYVVFDRILNTCAYIVSLSTFSGSDIVRFSEENQSCRVSIDPRMYLPPYKGFLQSRHRRSQDFVGGALFFPKKIDDFFSRRPEKNTLKLPK